MQYINKAAAAGVLFFAIILAAFVGIKVDQTTIALLGGAFIGLVVAIPTTALIMIVGLRRHDNDSPRNVHYHDQRRDPPSYLPPQSPQYTLPPEQWGGQVTNPSQPRIAAPVKRQHYVIGNDDSSVQEGW